MYSTRFYGHLVMKGQRLKSSNPNIAPPLFLLLSPSRRHCIQVQCSRALGFFFPSFSLSLLCCTIPILVFHRQKIQTLRRYIYVASFNHYYNSKYWHVFIKSKCRFAFAPFSCIRTIVFNIQAVGPTFCT
jgi:hypothetical protein